MPYVRQLFACGASSVGFSLILLASCSSGDGDDIVGVPPLGPPDRDAAAQQDAAPDAPGDRPDSGGDGGALDGATTGSCADFANAYCGRMTACGPGFFFPGQYLDAAECENTIRAQCTIDRAAPGVAVGANALGACARDLEGFSCSSFLARMLPESCGARGTLASGAACGSDLQCATGFCAKSSACGVCADAPARGAPCLAGRCGTGSTCSNGVGDDRECVALTLDVGGECGPSSYCRFGLSCVNGRCAAGLAEGALCSFGAPDQPDCDPLEGLRCNGFTAEASCQRPTYVGVGEGCGFNDVQTDAGLTLAPTECRADGICPSGPGGGPEGDSTCEARGALGESCDESRREPCRTQLACVGGQCVLSDPSACR